MKKVALLWMLLGLTFQSHAQLERKLTNVFCNFSCTQ